MLVRDACRDKDFYFLESMNSEVVGLHVGGLSMALGGLVGIIFLDYVL